MTLDEMSKKWLEEQDEKRKFNEHFYECGGKWFVFANEVRNALIQKMKEDGFLPENFKLY